jgi:hypothetical protein
MSVKPLVNKLKQAKLSPKTVNHYVITYIGQAVASLKNERTGEPIHYRKWDASVMDLPERRLEEANRVGVGINCSQCSQNSAVRAVEVAA